jgi:hypothetical protein
MVMQLRNRPAKSHLGCLLTLFVLAAVIFAGKNVAEVYWRAYRLSDYVKEQADFAPALTDDVIQRRLVDFADSLGLELGPRAWTIRRSWSPKEITIRAEYEDSVVIALLGMRKVWKVRFQPSAHAPL